MSDLLDKIDAALEQVEERLLAELASCRTLNPDAEYCHLDQRFKDKLLNTVTELGRRLENSGDIKRLELRTERHEVIHARMIMVRQVLESEIPVTYLHQVHEEIQESRNRLEARVLARRKKLEPDVTMGQRRQRGDSLKGLFDRDVGEKELSRNRYLVSEQEERDLEDLDNLDDFLDSGIYSASRELAMLANLIYRGATNKSRPEQPRGRAVFEAKELKTTIPPVNKVKPVPEPEPEPLPEAKQEQEEKRDIARTPEEIRRKLQERKYQSSGPASFGAKDIEPEHPREYYGPRREDEDQQEKNEKDAKDEKDEKDEKDDGKAIFESRDVSRSPWEKD